MKISKHITNKELADLLRSVAAALELSEGDNRFRIAAYQRAADSVEHASSGAKNLWDDGQIDTLSGIGESISGYLDEMFTTGHVRHFDRILKKYPAAMFELLRIPGVGPKSALRLCKALGITKASSAITKLQKAAQKGLVAGIEGFGPDSQTAMLRGIEEYQNRDRRLLLNDAQKTADDIITWLKKIPQVESADTLGSLRRRASTVGDIDISVSSGKPTEVITHFVSYPLRRRVLEQGDRTASIILPNDHQVDLMVQPPEAYGSLLVHFTGSKHHNIALRELAIKKGYSISEYGIKTKQGLKKFPDEKSFYSSLGLQFIPPELRENQGEIDQALKSALPDLVKTDQIKGDLQIHSNIDVQPGHDLGTSSISDLLDTSRRLGYEYIGLTEHNPSVTGHTREQVYELIKMKTNIIHTHNQTYEKKNENFPYIFNGLEIDIRPDGSRALPDECFELLDYACVSIHSSFNLERRTMTDRVIAGLNHPKVRFFAHPTARLLLEREGIELDWDRIFDFCLKQNKWLEINAWPNRLDLPDTLVREAIRLGVKIVVNTDSHAASHLALMPFGISVARRGWASVADIVNTLPLTEMRQLLIGSK